MDAGEMELLRRCYHGRLLLFLFFGFNFIIFLILKLLFYIFN
jgi:hypothetical protein